MMKNLILTAILCLSLFSCNKDEEIIIDNPNKPDSEQILPYKVIEYIPAPGQYINESVSGFDDIHSEEEACLQTEKRFKSNLYVSLGAWGGYIVVRFNEEIKNSSDYDFAISTNAFDSSSEPGIIWVMQDANSNGIADDTWYELKGSYYDKPGYQKDYWITYFRPQAKGHTEWIDSDGESGQISWVGNYHNQDYYYPSWIEEDSYTLYGSRLPLQAVEDPTTGNWTNLPFEWGYADNFGEDFNPSLSTNYFKISNAINNNGDYVNLSSIDFIKVQTAINGSAGWLGENSTEVCGFFTIN